jgi:predicted secreted protein
MFMRKRIVIFIIFIIMLAFPKVSAAILPGDFIDVKGSWPETEIQTVFKLGLMSGIGTDAQGFNVFAPDGLVTRAQLSSVLVRTFRLDYDQIRFIKEPLASDYYQDIDNKAWYANDVLMCAINEIFPGTKNFSPDSAVSRLEIARAIQQSFTAKGIIIPMIMSMPIYEDTNDLSQQDMNAVVFVSNTGIMKGDSLRFRPGDNVNRAELARILMRCSELSGVNENNNGQEYTVAVGQNFVVSLASNPSTGYVWHVSKPDDEKVLAYTDANYISAGNSNQIIPGQGGRSYWSFTALQAGTTEIAIVYARPWESVQPAQKFTLRVIVN